MASDEELARRIARVERGGGQTSTERIVSDEVDDLRSTAGEIHDELARRIEAVDDRKVDADDLSQVIDRLDRLERRLEDLETRV